MRTLKIISMCIFGITASVLAAIAGTVLGNMIGDLIRSWAGL